jgi:hypothetical protein
MPAWQSLQIRTQSTGRHNMEFHEEQLHSRPAKPPQPIAAKPEKAGANSL